MSERATPHPGGTFPLGGHEVARIGYGAMQLEAPAAGSASERAAAIGLVRRAIELGVEHIDTAGFYGDAVVNGLLREALSPYPDELVIVSKVGAVHRPGGEIALAPAQRPEELRAGVEADLRSLGVERIDVVNLRRLDRRPGLVAEGEQRVELDDQLAELANLRDEGKIGAIGLSAVDEPQIRQALPAEIVCVQNSYSLVDRAGEAALELCRDHGIAWVPFFPLGGRFPGMPKVADLAPAIAVAKELSMTAAQVGLAWLLHHAPNILLIPGTSRLAHLEANLAVGEIVLPAEAVGALDAAGLA